MDKNGLIDRQYEQAAETDRGFAALLPKDRTPSTIAGDKVVVVDSSRVETTEEPRPQAKVGFADPSTDPGAPQPHL